MAALSPETDAIIKRLKAEGELIRNSGTNSLRTLNVKLDKFDSLFSSINANMVEQTTLLERQLGIAKQTEAATKNQEQFDELKRTAPMADKDDSGSKRKERKPNWVDKIPDMLGNGIASAFTMKNLALGAAGVFVGYNLLKGAIDEKTGGGFSEFESGLVSFGRGLGDIDMTAIQEDFASLKTSIAGIAASLTSLTAAIEMITSLDWQTVVASVLGSMSLLAAYTTTLRTANLLGITSSLGGGRSPPRAGRSWLRRLLGRRTAVLGGAALAAGAAGALTGAGDNLVDDVVPNPRNLTAAQRAALSGTGDFATNVAPKVMSNMPDVRFNYDPTNDKYTSIATGQTLTGTARDAAERARIRRMPLPTLPNAVMDSSFKPPRPPLLVVPNPRAVADEFIRANRGKITIAITKEIPGLVAKSVPILGLFVGLGFMVWSISKADWTSAAAEGVSLMLPGFTGLPLDIAAAATSVFNEVTGRTYLQWREDDRLVMLQIADMMWSEYMKYMEDAENRKRREFDALPEADRAARVAEAEYIAGGGRPGMRGMGENNTGSISLGSYNGAPDNTLGQSSAFRGSYFAGTDGFMYFQPSANSEGSLMAQRIGKISELSASPAVVVRGGDTHITSTPVSQHGGNHNSAVTVIGTGSPGESNRTLPGFVN